MHCFVLLIFLLSCYYQYTIAVQFHFLPPPLLVTCSNPQHHVYQRHDNELHISCFWDGKVDLKYSRNQRLASEIKGDDPGMQAPPYCHWYQDSILVKDTSSWSGQLVLSTGVDRGDPHSPLAFTHVIMQCVSAFCAMPTCSHNNLSIEVARQDVHLFLLSPQNLPIWEWEPVQLGWCARLKSSTWNYRFMSKGGSPAEALIPSNQHSEPLAPPVFPHAEWHSMCASYYSYHTTVHYPHRGFYTASLQIENGPQLTRSLDLHVQPALLHVFSTTPTLLRLPHRILNFSWTLRPLSPGIMAYSLADEQGLEQWSPSHNYNPFAVQSDFCATPTSQSSRGKVIAHIYFRTNDRISGELVGKIDFSNKTLTFRTGSATPMYLTLNPRKVQMGIYSFSRSLGLYHSTQEIQNTNNTRENPSLHYVFYQQQGLSYLIALEFIQRRWCRFSMQLYLNRRDTLFKSLGEKNMDIHLFSDHSPEENVVYIVWFIPLQHPQLQCEWAFHLQLLDSRKKHLLWNQTYTYRNHVKSASCFLPHSVLSFKPTLYTGFIAPVNCRKIGLAHAVLKATVNTFASKVMETTVACQKSYCHELTATIQKPNPSDHVMRYKRGSAVTLQATTNAECSTSSSLSLSWNIYSLKMASSVPDWANPLMLPNEIHADGVIFNIPRNVLPYGVYHVNVTMTVLLPAYAIRVVESDSTVLQILPSDLVAVIAGGFFRTVGVSDPWALNASASFDPDSAKPLEGLTFRWYCTKEELDYSVMKLSPYQKCQPYQMNLLWSYSTYSVQMVKPSTLQENMKYYFVLTIQKRDRMASAFQTVHVVAGSVPLLDVTCLENCEKPFKVSERFILSARCLNCEKSEPVYLWTLLSANSKEIHVDWASKTKTGRSNPYMHLNPFAFQYMVGKSYTLSLKVSTQGRHPAVYGYSFYVNSPPQAGKCNIYPKEGTAFLTKFTVQCTGFEVKNGPLTYKVMAHSDPTETNTTSLQNTVFGTAVYIGYQQKTPPSFLPPGSPSKHYALMIYVQVYDADGIFSQVSLQATVYDPGRNRSSENVLYELNSLVRGLNSPESALLKTKDYLRMGFYIYMVASTLNNIKTSPLIYDLKTGLRGILLNISAGIPLTGIQIINQMISSICQITWDVNEITRESQLLAVRILKDATEVLKRHRLKDLKSTEAEVLGNSIFMGLSNVLRASVLNHQAININGAKEAIRGTKILADLILESKVPGEHETNMKAKDWSLHLWKNEKRDVFGALSMKHQCRNCFYPQLSQKSHTELPADAVVSTVHYVFDKDPFPWLGNTSDIHTAVIGFKIIGARANGDLVGLNPGVAHVILAREDKKSGPFNLTIGPDRELYKTTGGFNIEVEQTTKDIFIQILCELNITFDVSIHPGLNVSHPPIAAYTAFSDKPPVPHEPHSTVTDCTIQAPYILCLPHSLLRSAFQGNRRNMWNISVVIRSDPIVRRQTAKVVRAVVFTADCLHLDSLQNQWKEGSCRLGPQTSWSKIHCVCELKEPSTITSRQLPNDFDIHFLSGKFVLYPNPLDINKVLLAEFDANPVTLFTVFSIFAGCIFCATWARIKDKADLKRKNKILVLPDNDPYQKVRYLITIYTGSRLGSGTTADIYLELIGQNGISDVHHMKHPQFHSFSRASIDTFLLTTKHDLGQILSIHIWHNTSGSSPNWYLSRVNVHNVQTKQSWLFLCRNWLGLGKADGKIERSFAAKTLKSSLNKMDYFLISLARDLEESHIWLSIFSEVATGTFTRVQRVSCCLVIMLTTLLFNIMFFSGEEEKEVISRRQRYLKSLYIGFVSALFSIPVQLTITILFKYSQDKPSVQNTSESGPRRDLPSLSDTLEEEGTFLDPHTPSVKSLDVPFPAYNANNNNVADEEDSDSSDIDQMAVHPELLFFFKTPRFSWWWRYVSWVLVFSISGASAFLIILYGLTYGYTTSIEWFIASMTSFFESVLLLQTLKMGLISAMSTITLKYCENINWINTEQYQQMKLVQFSMDDNEMRRLHYELIRVRRTMEYAPLTEDELIVLRKTVRAQHLAFVFVKDIICHLLFSSCVLSVAYSTEPTTTFYYNKAIYNMFSPGLSQVNKLEHIYMWMSNVFVPLIHNDYEPTYLSESWSKIIGLPRMRQIRAKKTQKTCFPSLSFINKYAISKSHCRHKYNTDAEDQSDYLGSWTNPANQPASNHSSSFQGFTYQSDISQWEYKSYGVFNSYGPGGYSFYFFPREQRPNTTLRLDDLQRNNWLDERTWAVIFELTTFNPDVNLYCSITVMFETSDVGVVNASLSVHSYKLSIFRYETNSQMFVYGLMVYILVFYLADEFHMLRQERIGYLKTATNLNNFAIKTICMFFILLIALKFKMAFTLLEFHLVNPEEFVPFHVVSQIDQLYRMVTGVLAFLLVLKPYRYFRFLYKMRLAEKTMSAAFPGFVHLTTVTALLFSTYVSFGYLVFGEYEWNYNTLIRSLQTVVSYCFSGLNRSGVVTSDRWLGIFFRCSFMIAVLCVFLNLWRVLLMSTYISMKQTVYEQHSDEAEAINFVVLKIRHIWRSITYQTSSGSDTDVANTVIFGKPVITNEQQQGLKTKQIGGKKMVYLSV